MVIILIKRIKNSFKSLRFVLIVTYLCVGIIPILAFATSVFSSTDEYFIDKRKKELLSQANLIAENIYNSNYLYDDSKKNSFDIDIWSSSKQNNFRIIVVDKTGLVVNDSNRTETGKILVIPEIVEALNNKDISKEQPNDVIYTAVSIKDSNSNKLGAVLVVSDIKDLALITSDLREEIYILLVIVMIFSFIIIFLVSQLVTDPLKNVVNVIKKMSDGHFNQRIKVFKYSGTEIAELATACNIMAEKLESVEKSREQFVSNVSHELKTPLSSIKVLSESILLEKDVPREVYVEFLQDINSEVDRMTAIINNLLTLVRLNQNVIPVNFISTDLDTVISKIIKRLSPLAQIKSIEINYVVTKPFVADIDEMKFTLAISNLIDNAIKYTPEGGNVSVTLDGDHQNAFITVSDTGIGIPEKDINKIFERFYRVDKVRDRETGGTGLGLSITNSTILMHNGSIKVTSKEGEGTTFVVRIPLKQNSTVINNQ